MGPSMSYHLPRSCVTLAIVACYGSFVPSLYLLTPFICVRIHCLPYSFKIFFLHLFTSSIFFFIFLHFFSLFFSSSLVSLFCIYFYFIPFLPSVLATPLFFHLLFIVVAPVVVEVGNVFCLFFVFLSKVMIFVGFVFNWCQESRRLSLKFFSMMIHVCKTLGNLMRQDKGSSNFKN